MLKLKHEMRAWTDPFSELIVHHEVMDVLLSACQLQFASKHCHHERRTAGTLHAAATQDWEKHTKCKCFAQWRKQVQDDLGHGLGQR